MSINSKWKEKSTITPQVYFDKLYYENFWEVERLMNYKPMHLISTIIVFRKQETGERKNLVVVIAAL